MPTVPGALVLGSGAGRSVGVAPRLAAAGDDEPTQRLATSLLKALRIMEALGADPEVSLAELSRRTGLGKGTVHRVLATLATRGYVERVGNNGLYCLGIRVFELGAQAAANRNVRTAARDPMRELSEATGEVVNLGVPAGDGIVVVEQEQGHQMVQMRAHVGNRLPLATTSLGRAYLSTLPVAEAEALAPELAEELAATRARGFAIDNGNYQPDLRCTGAAIFDASGQVVSLIGISAPAYRAPLERLVGDLGPRVLAAAAQISTNLGGQPRHLGGIAEVVKGVTGGPAGQAPHGAHRPAG